MGLPLQFTPALESVPISVQLTPPSDIALKMSGTPSIDTFFSKVVMLRNRDGKLEIHQVWVAGDDEAGDRERDPQRREDGPEEEHHRDQNVLVKHATLP